MIKLQFSKPSYHTYDNGKVTTCVYECKVIICNTKELLDTFKVTGKAVCSPNDVVNPTTGRRIADSKAKLAAYKTAKNHWSAFFNKELNKSLLIVKNIANFINQMQYLKKSEEKHILELCNV